MKIDFCTFTVEMEKERRRRQQGLQCAQLEAVCGFCLPVFKNEFSGELKILDQIPEIEVLHLEKAMDF